MRPSLFFVFAVIDNRIKVPEELAEIVTTLK